MPVATPEIYAQMLDTAKEKGFAFPAINVSSSQTLNAALKGFADAESDGIIQISTGGAEYLSGPAVKNMVSGSVAFAAYAVEVAKSYPIHVALHTDHCPKGKLDGFVRPLIDISAERVARGEAPLFQSHMWDGSAVPLGENLEIAQELLATCAAVHLASRSRAISRFSVRGTAEPSHMWDWKRGASPRLTRSALMSTRGRTKPSSLSLGQWSVCRATWIG